MIRSNVVFKPRNRAERRRGVAMVYFALSLTVMIGMIGFALDMGRLYVVGAQAQKAADAAALAGAVHIYDEIDKDANAKAATEKLARWNGFDIANGAESVVVNSKINPDGSHPNWHRAFVSKRVPLYFMPILGLHFNEIKARATAEYVSSVPMTAHSKENYGKESVGNVNLTAFGPYGLYSHGDAYSTRWLDNGTPNPRYTGKGYDFDYIVGAGYTDSSIQFQIFDPDCYNKGGVDYVNGNEAIDEIRSNNTEKPGWSAVTKTRYTLYAVNSDGSTGRQIGQIDYAGDSTTDMKWTTPNNFEITDLNSGGYAANDDGNRHFRINVTTIEGSSENGFDLRAGKVGADGKFDVSNTSVTALGRLPVNFNADGDVKLDLAQIPAPPAGSANPEVIISKYDTDVGSKKVNYVLDPPPTDTNYVPGVGYPGELSGNGQWLNDTVKVPGGYKEATWSAVYTAGANDTSVWEVKADFGTGGFGSLHLVQ